VSLIRLLSCGLADVHLACAIPFLIFNKFIINFLPQTSTAPQKIGYIVSTELLHQSLYLKTLPRITLPADSKDSSSSGDSTPRRTHMRTNTFGAITNESKIGFPCFIMTLLTILSSDLVPVNVSLEKKKQGPPRVVKLRDE
jgi:hypothetical protein